MRDPSTLSIRRVMVMSLHAWKRDFVFLTVLAAIVETPIVLVELGLHVAPGIDVDPSSGATGLARLLTIALPTLIYGVLAHHFLSGVMESVEGAERHGHPRPTLRQLAATLPWGKLLIADVVVNLSMLVGFLFFVVPGIVIGTYLAAALPLTNMERQSIGPTLRRSYSITRGHFWKAFVIWAITAVVVDGAQEAASDFLGHLIHNRLWEFVTHLGSDVLFLPLQALPIVMLTFDLVTIDRIRRAPTDAPRDEGRQDAATTGVAEVTD